MAPEGGPEPEPELQLAALARVGELLARAQVDHWLFGGWAVDFHAGSVTRPHDDLDVAVWLADVPRIVQCLEGDGWRHAPLEGEDGGTGYERRGVRLELTYLAPDGAGRVCVPLRDGPADWPASALGDDVEELQGVRARVVSLSALLRMKSVPREDAGDVAKDRADVELLSRLAAARQPGA